MVLVIIWPAEIVFVTIELAVSEVVKICDVDKNDVRNVSVIRAEPVNWLVEMARVLNPSTMTFPEPTRSAPVEISAAFSVCAPKNPGALTIPVDTRSACTVERVAELAMTFERAANPAVAVRKFPAAAVRIPVDRCIVLTAPDLTSPPLRIDVERARVLRDVPWADLDVIGPVVRFTVIMEDRTVFRVLSVAVDTSSALAVCRSRVSKTNEAVEILVVLIESATISLASRT
jgi:hypothetical protein